jgi:hypothetical protein
MDNHSASGTVHKEILTNLLIGLFMGNTPTPDALVKFIKLHKDKIYHPNDVPNKLMGPIHSLCMQPIANRMILLFVRKDNQTMIGKTDLRTFHVVLKLHFKNNTAAVVIGRYWEGINFSYT